MVSIRRGEIWWADLGDPHDSEPAHRRPVLVVQNDAFNRSNLATVIVLALTSNLRLADLPGNVPLTKKQSGLKKDSVINITQVTTIDKTWLDTKVGKLPKSIMEQVNTGLALVLEMVE